jgi:hypothetical protein
MALGYYLAYVLADLFDQYQLDCLHYRLKITLPSGQHGHGGTIFTKLEKEATRQQSTEIKLNRLLAIVLLLRLVPRDCL